MLLSAESYDFIQTKKNVTRHVLLPSAKDQSITQTKNDISLSKLAKFLFEGQGKLINVRRCLNMSKIITAGCLVTFSKTTNLNGIR